MELDKTVSKYNMEWNKDNNIKCNKWNKKYYFKRT